MKKTVIWKYPLDRGTLTKLCVPQGANVLSVARQRCVLNGIADIYDVAYFEVDPSAFLLVEWHIIGIPTGMLNVPKDAKFIGTVVGEDSLVFHYYSKEILPVSPAKET